MMKYHKEMFCKIISVLVALAMLIATPLGTVQIYAEEGVEPDTTPPSFVEGYPKEAPQAKGSRQISIVINSLEKAYHYFVLLPDSSLAPSKEQVVAGKDGAGNIALKASNSGSNKYDSIQASTFAPLHNTSYDIYVVLKDDAGNLSEPAHVNVTSPQAQDFFVTGFPQIGSVQPDGSRQVEINVKLQNINSERKGKIYWALLPNGATPPSIEQIAAGTDGNNLPAISSGSPEFNNNSEESFLVTGAAGETEYDLYMVVGHTYFAYPLAECTEIIKRDVTTPKDIEGEKVCAIGSIEYATLSEAFYNVKTGETIILLKSFTSVNDITIDSKNININLNGQILNIATTANVGLKATNSTITLTGEGKLNVSGKLYGVWAGASSNITVTNATASDTEELGIGVYAVTGSEVTILENVFGTAHGVRAENIYTKVIVNGDVSSKGQIKGAVHSEGQADVVVKGNVTNTMGYGVHSYNGGISVEKNVNGSHVGAIAEGNVANITITGDLLSYSNGAVIITGSGSITVDGEIITSGNYVRINSTNLTRTEGITDAEKSGYLKYSVSDVSGKVWVKDPMSNMVCKIGDAYYDDFSKALTDIKTGETIELLKDIGYTKSINYDGAISVKGIKIIIDLNGYKLSINNPTYSGLDLSNDAEVNVTGGGKLTINSRFAALNITNSKFTSDKTVEVLLESELNSGISAYSSSIVNILKGTIKGSINAYSNNNITVAGPVTSNRTGESHGISLTGTGNTLFVGSVEVLEGTGSGIYIEEGGSVTIGSAENPGYVIGMGNGITTRQGSKRAYVNVYGNIESGAHGIFASDDAEIKVYGNVKSTSTNTGVYCVKSFAGITSSQNNLIEINGDVEGINGVYVGGSFGNIKVTGNVYATGNTTDNCGSFASYGTIHVDGNINAPNCIGAYAGDNGQIIINGFLAGKEYIWVYYELKTEEDKTIPTTKEGYHTYSKGTAAVWIKDGVVVPPTKYIITASAEIGGSISPKGNIEVEENSNQTFVIIPSNNYKIVSVVVDGVDQGAISTYTFNNVTTNHTINAIFDITASNVENGSSKSSSTTIVTFKPDKMPNQPLIGATILNTKLDNNSEGIVTVYDNIVKDVINKTNIEADKQGRTKNGIGVCIETKNPKNMNAINIILTQSTLKLLTDTKVQQFEIECDLLNLNFNLEALLELRKQSSGDITIRITPNNKFTNSEKDLIEIRSTYDVALSYLSNGKSLNIKDLNNGKVTLSIPYTTGQDEAVNYLFGIMVDDNGSVNRILNSFYDANNKKVIIDNDIFSMYGIGYVAPSAKFTDISSHWAKKGIDYTVGRGLFKGTTDTTFSPDLTVSRGMLVTILGRLTEANVNTYKVSSFSDVANDMYYMPYIEWAYMNGIVKGVDDSKFEPDRGMTREEVALVLKNYAKAANFNIPVLHEYIVFVDNDNINDFANDAVKIIQQADIMTGDQNNKFNPRHAVSRGEVATILQRYIKLIIDYKTSQGWVFQDDGQWYYYKDGKNLTGWQSIDDKKYYFKDNGALQNGWVKDNNNWIMIEK